MSIDYYLPIPEDKNKFRAAIVPAGEAINEICIRVHKNLVAPAAYNFIQLYETYYYGTSGPEGSK